MANFTSMYSDGSGIASDSPIMQSITFVKADENIYNVVGNEIQRSGKNTWEDWHLLASSRPVFAPPAPKTSMIDLPGGNGKLDLSEALTKYPLYDNRSGSFTFRVMNGYGNWADRYSEIMEYIHGQSMRALLADDDQWFYQGRFSVTDWQSTETWSEITFSYDVGPFKWSVQSSSEPWFWDPFNFETGIIPLDDFTGFEVNGTAAKEFNEVYFGKVPVSPVIKFTPSRENTALTIKFKNDFLGIEESVTVKGGSTFVPAFVFYGHQNGGTYKMEFIGSGTVAIDFRVGRL